MDLQTGKIYPDKKSAFAAGATDVVGIDGTEEQVERLSQAIQDLNRKQRRAQARRERKRNDGTERVVI